MTAAPPPERLRLVTCRACGNRVRRGATRCAACGTPRPSLADPTAGQGARPRRRRRRSVAGIAAAAALAGVVVGAGLVFTTLRGGPAPGARFAVPTVDSMAPAAGPATPAPPAASTTVDRATPRAAVPAAGAPASGSRSRGRDDWTFFFRVGDRLARMGDQQPLGVVQAAVKRHVFPDGTSGPAYVLRGPSGADVTIDADELERGARVH